VAACRGSLSRRCVSHENPCCPSIFIDCSGPCDDKPRALSVCSKVIGAWAMGADEFAYPEEAGIPIGQFHNSKL